MCIYKKANILVIIYIILSCALNELNDFYITHVAQRAYIHLARGVPVHGQVQKAAIKI